MKLSLLSFKRVSALAVFGLMTGLPISAQALTWKLGVGGSGTWNETGGSDWSGGSWVNGGDATFNVGSGTVIIGTFATSLDIGTLDFTAGAGSYTFDNSPSLPGAGAGSGTPINFNGAGITQAGAGTQIILSSGEVNFNNSASAGTSNIQLQTDNALKFNATSSGGTASITNYGGTLQLNGTSSTGGLTISNGGTIDASLHTTGASLGNVTNITNGGATPGVDFAGSIITASNQLNSSNALTVGNLTLSNANPGTFGQNTLNFTLTNPNSGSTFIAPFDPGNIAGTSLAKQGRIVLGAGNTFALPTSFDGTVTISLTGANVAEGTYTLIDWTAAGATATGLNGLNNLADFVLDTSGTTNLAAASHLEIQGNRLVLVAVPEPATFAMPIVACLGLLGLRRRASRMPVAQA